MLCYVKTRNAAQRSVIQINKYYKSLDGWGVGRLLV